MEHAPETETLWKELHDRLLAYIRGRVSPVEDAEDILHDVFLRVQANQPRLKDVRNVAAWLYRVTSNAIIDHYRAQKKAAGALAGFADESGNPGTTTAPEEEAGDESSEQRAAFRGCVETLLKRLPEQYSEAVRLTDLNGLTQTEAAARLGLSTSGMKSRVQRGRAKLKDHLLACCEVELDSRRRVVGYEPRGDGCPDGDCECS
jgi:RNA polymerase sigma-70 factor (ECF subfamily)